MTVMSYPYQCSDAGFGCTDVPLRFSNSRQSLNGDPLGVPYGGGGLAGVNGPADAAAVLNATGPAVSLWRDRPTGANRPPRTASLLPNQRWWRATCATWMCRGRSPIRMATRCVTRYRRQDHSW